LIWEVVAVDIGTGHRTILESWTDCRRAIARAEQLTRERVNALPDYRETRQ
jgi:hypothetical protein